MKLSSKILLMLAGLSLIPLYFTPFWTINMQAPQFPEGIGMYIYINDVQGHNRHDIQSINILNHYIGMQEIDVEQIPEIRIMPWIFAVLIGSLLLIALSGSYRFLAIWIVTFVVLGIIGFIDYYMWGYEYGHNLSPDAPIKVPGMSYQPPLIGTKQLLNIKAGSWPYWGSLYMLISFTLACFVLWKDCANHTFIPRKFRKI